MSSFGASRLEVASAPPLDILSCRARSLVAHFVRRVVGAFAHLIDCIIDFIARRLLAVPDRIHGLVDFLARALQGAFAFTAGQAGQESSRKHSSENMVLVHRSPRDV